MSNLSKSIALLTMAAQVPLANAAIAPSASDAPVVMSFRQDDDSFRESTRLTRFTEQLIGDIQTQMMPVGCDGDYDCYKKICGTGTFSGRKAQVDDSDAAC